VFLFMLSVGAAYAQLPARLRTLRAVGWWTDQACGRIAFRCGQVVRAGDSGEALEAVRIKDPNQQNPR